jgi:cellulose biosynthesis protein BcsQ
VRFAEAPQAGRSIMRTAARTPGAQAYRELAQQLSDDIKARS